MASNTPTIEDLLTLTVTDLKRLGFLRKGDKHNGGVQWERGGERIASIYVITDCTGELGKCRLVYQHPNDKITDYTLYLRFKQSNLNDQQGFYYFVCPVTGRSCRKLYLVGERFISRYAFRSLYAKQRYSKAQRAELLTVLREWNQYEQLAAQPYRKTTYRGKPTPYGKQLERYETTAADLMEFYKLAFKNAVDNIKIREAYLAQFGRFLK